LNVVHVSFSVCREQRAEKKEISQSHWLNGLALFTTHIPSKTSFDSAFRSIDEHIIERTQKLIPLYGNSDIPDTFYDTWNKNLCSGYNLASQAVIFDSVAASAIGYCNAKAEIMSENSTCEISGKDVLDEIANLSFEGASGPISLSSAHVSNHIWNIRKVENSYRYVSSYERLNGIWKQTNSFVYSDGSLYPPSDLRLATTSESTLPKNLKLFVNIICFFAVLLCACFSMIIRVKRDNFTSSDLQQYFLYGLCTSSSFIMLSIVLQNVDGSQDLSSSVLDFICYFKAILRIFGRIMYYFLCVVKVSFFRSFHVYFLHKCISIDIMVSWLM